MNKKIILAITFMLGMFPLTLVAMDGSNILRDLSSGIDKLDKPIRDANDLQGILSTLIKIDGFIKVYYPDFTNVPSKLVNGMGIIIGLFCNHSPLSLQDIEHIILPYLKKGLLTHEDCKTPDYKFKFGLLEGVANTKTVSNDLIRTMPNGQALGSHYHINLPVYFNRFYSEYKGEYLLIGGGEKCDCGDAQNKHPRNKFFHLDIDNHHLPDLVAHAGYEGHLRALPTAKFSFIWFEHCNIPALMDKDDKRAFNQYFRILKPGGIILFQSNFLIPNCGYNDYAERGYQSMIENFASYNFAILENKNLVVIRNNEEQHFRQIILMKPFPSLFEEEMMDPEPRIRINIEKCIIPNKDIQKLGLFRAKILSHQEATSNSSISWTELFNLFPLKK